MGEGHVEARGSHRRGSNQRFAVKMEFGFSGWQPLDFDIYPLHAGRPACSQRFESGFLGSKTRWEQAGRSEEHTSELQSRSDLVCRLLLEKKNKAMQSLGIRSHVRLCADSPRRTQH